jgi:hypothetical protein
LANRSLSILTSVPAGTTDTRDLTPIPNGKTIVIKRVKISEPNGGDNKSSIFVVQWGTVGSFLEVFAGAITGDFREIDLREDLLGDGVKFIRILRQNTSATNKRLMFWLEAFDRD